MELHNLASPGRLQMNNLFGASDLASVDYRKESQSGQLWDSPFFILMPAVSTGVDSEQRTVCELRCADAAVASIRFRIAMKRWPGSVDQLVPNYLKVVPVDPFTGESIRFKPENGGILVYGAGKDRKDDGGRLNPAASWLRRRLPRSLPVKR